MDKPTAAQEKKFWEGYGLVHIDNLVPLEVANSCEAMALDKPISGWYKPNYKKATSELVSFRVVPKIDLNNLFKYAVPKYIDGIKAGVSANYIGNAYARLFERWQKELFLTDWEDPALALFWVLDKVREDSNGTAKTTQ